MSKYILRMENKKTINSKLKKKKTLKKAYFIINGIHFVVQSLKKGLLYLSQISFHSHTIGTFDWDSLFLKWAKLKNSPQTCVFYDFVCKYRFFL